MSDRNLPTIADIEKMDLAQLQILDIDVLEAIQAEIEERAASVTHDKVALQSILAMLFDDHADAEFKALSKDTGSVEFELRGRKIGAKREKKLDWDQAFLAKLWSTIEAAGDDPAVYIKREPVTYKVSEAAYKDWPTDVQAAFSPGRTVKPVATKFTFKPKETK